MSAVRVKSKPGEITLENIAALMMDGQKLMKERWDELKADFDQKHNENRDRRHALGNKIEEVDNRVHVIGERVGALEIKLVSVIGDNSGGSGLLHDIDKKVDALKDEVQAIKTTVQDTPKINKWVYGAMAVVAFLLFAIPIMMMAFLELFRFITRH